MGLAERVAESFGSQLQCIRRRRGWNQDAFADAMGLSRTSVSNIERGLQRVYLDHVYRAAHILGVPIEDLLPSDESIRPDVGFRSAADDPLPPAAAQNLTEVMRELGVDAIEDLRSDKDKSN